MKLLIIKGLFLTVSTCVALCLFTIADRYIMNENASFNIDPNAKHVVLGHSHPERAYNDSLIDNFKNLANSGEAYFYTYAKIKNIIPVNEQIKAVFIEFSNTNITKNMDNWIWGDAYLYSKFKAIEPFIPLEDQVVVLRNNFSNYTEVFLSARKRNLAKILKDKYIFSNYFLFGGYKHLVRDKMDSLLKAQKHPPVPYGPAFNSYSETNIAYLEKIVDFLEQHNRKVYFVRTPQHPLSPGRKNELLLQKIKEEKFPSIEYLDFNDFYLETEDYGDFAHVNYRGARKFSTFFNTLLDAGLLKEKNKQRFVHEQMKLHFENENRRQQLKTKEE